MAGFDGMEIFFFLCALVGGVFVIFRMVLQFAGGHSADGMSDDLPVDAHHVDSDLGFKLLSLHGLTSFLMMFGLVGLALYRQSGVGVALSLTGATLAGLGTVWVIAKLFQLAGSMQSSGTVSATAGVLASTGTVYLTIPKGGTGRVTINVRNRLREFDAVSTDGEELRTGTAVQVIDLAGNVVVVRSMDSNR